MGKFAVDAVGNLLDALLIGRPPTGDEPLDELSCGGAAWHDEAMSLNNCYIKVRAERDWRPLYSEVWFWELWHEGSLFRSSNAHSTENGARLAAEAAINEMLSVRDR